jgi:hypothetical protein
MAALLQPDAPVGLWMLVLLLLSYIAVLGPGSILVARRRKRPDWGWRVLLSSIVIFSLFSYGLAFYENRTSLLDNSIALMQLSQDGSSAYIRTYARVFVPDQGNYQVDIPGKGLAQLIPDDLYQQDVDASNEERSLAIILQQHETEVKLLGASMWSSHAILLEQDRPVHGGIVSHLVLRDGTLTGTITNTLSSPLSDAYVLIPNSFARIGHIAAGQTLQVNLPFSPATINANMTLADQIAKASGLPIPYIPDVHDSPPQTALQRHLAILSLLSGEAFNFSVCSTCGMQPIKHTMVAPFTTGMTISPTNSNDPLLLAGAPATFIGWAEQSLDTSSDITINGFKPGGLHETLVQAPLTLRISSPQPLADLEG